MWQQLLAACTPETLRHRFGYLFQSPTHQMAARFCFIDYDREMALVAEMRTNGGRRIVGVGRLIADAGLELIADVPGRWHDLDAPIVGRGLHADLYVARRPHG